MANTIIKEVNSKEETYDLAFSIGENISKPLLICLDGDLGVGKTVFAKGLAKGMGIEEDIVSPTFVLFNVYEDGKLPLYHFDVYRIEEPEEMYEIGYEEYFFGAGVCLVEWASLIEELIPEDAVHIAIYKDPKKGEDHRRIVIENL